MPDLICPVSLKKVPTCICLAPSDVDWILVHTTVEFHLCMQDTWNLAHMTILQNFTSEMAVIVTKGYICTLNTQSIKDSLVYNLACFNRLLESPLTTFAYFLLLLNGWVTCSCVFLINEWMFVVTCCLGAQAHPIIHPKRGYHLIHVVSVGVQGTEQRGRPGLCFYQCIWVGKTGRFYITIEPQCCQCGMVFVTFPYDLE